MGCFGRHLAVFFILLSATLCSASFRECYSAEKISRFWEAPAYEQGNQQIINFQLFYFYSFSFDNSTQSASLENLSLADADNLAASFPSIPARDFSPVSAALSASSSSLSNSSASQRAAHFTLQAAKKAAETLFSQEQMALLITPSPLVPIALADSIMKVQALSDYAVYYPLQFKRFLSSLANAYDSSNSAAEELAKLADSQFDSLSYAGAGSPEYSGRAKAAYLQSASLLSSKQFCASHLADADAISAYFSSSPALPDFSSPGIADYLQSTAGKNENSSIMRLAKAYSGLSEANAQMQSEYDTGLLRSRGLVRQLSIEVDLLEKERLDLIQQPIIPSTSGSTAYIGSQFSGIYAGLQQAKQGLAQSQNGFADAQLSFSSARAEGYLAAAISELESASQSANSSLSSLASVRSNAQSAVGMEQQFASEMISKAEAKTSEKSLSVGDAQAISEASALLKSAKAEFSSAESQKSLGERFAAYGKAASLASESLLRAEGRAALPALESAKQQLGSLSSLISAAQSDGLDMAYEKGKLSDYLQLLSDASSPDAYSIVLDAARQDEEAILLRLSEKYPGIGEKYVQTKLIISEIQKTKPQFLPEFSSLSGYFSDGKLQIRAAAGKIAKISASLDSYYIAAQKELPAHLSALLSSNAEALETMEQPVLGRQTKYAATISTLNPSAFGYSGQLTFFLPTKIPVYSADFESGDEITDAYPEKGKTTIVLPRVEAWQAFAFKAKKSEQPAQITSSQDSCSIASPEQSEIRRTIEFFASRDLPLLGIYENAPAGAFSAKAKYFGRSFGLQLSGTAAYGDIEGAKQGKNSLEISYLVFSPFAFSTGVRAFEPAGIGKKKISYLAEVSSIAIDCNSASLAIDEPFSQISGFSVESLSGSKVSQAKAIASGTTTHLSFQFSPLKTGTTESFAISYVLSNQSEAISEALLQAELQAKYYNRSSDAEALSEAKNLLSQNRTDEALALLSQMRQSAQALAISRSSPDYSQFLEENTSASQLLQSVKDTQAQLSSGNMSEWAAKLQALSSPLQSALESASSDAEAGNYAKALASARKATAEFRSSLSSLAWKSSEEAADGYAKARGVQSPDAAALRAAQDEITRAQQLFSEGEHLQSLLSSSRALQMLAEMAGTQEQRGLEAKAGTDAITLQFAALHANTQQLLTNYSALYSSLSASSKKQLPLTPSQAQSRIDDAAKSLAAAQKAKLPQQALQQANQSYSSLQAVSQSLQDSIITLGQSAASSLKVAQLALSEARQKSSPEESSDISQIASEVSKAEDFLANSLYADSLMSSDRAVSAANAFLSRKTSPAFDTKAVALGAISLAFLAAAAYYFTVMKKPGGKPKGEKKKVQKEETEKD
jgi:hypothetical protein